MWDKSDTYYPGVVFILIESGQPISFAYSENEAKQWAKQVVGRSYKLLYNIQNRQ